jgi:hypothetical protein
MLNRRELLQAGIGAAAALALPAVASANLTVSDRPFCWKLRCVNSPKEVLTVYHAKSVYDLDDDINWVDYDAQRGLVVGELEEQKIYAAFRDNPKNKTGIKRYNWLHPNIRKEFELYKHYIDRTTWSWYTKGLHFHIFKTKPGTADTHNGLAMGPLNPGSDYIAVRHTGTEIYGKGVYFLEYGRLEPWGSVPYPGGGFISRGADYVPTMLTPRESIIHPKLLGKIAPYHKF